jgi:hypothetical protein
MSKKLTYIIIKLINVSSMCRFNKMRAPKEELCGIIRDVS